MDPITLGLVGGSLISGIGSLFGAHNQDTANRQNLQAQQERYNQLLGMVNGQMQSGPNPYSSKILGFLNQQQPQGQTYNAAQLGNFGTLGQPGQVAPQMVTGTQGNNAGQDALMQMMNRDISAPRDPSIDPMLQSGLGSFDNSSLFNALAPLDQQTLDQQVSQLHGSAGSFGERFGTAMMDNERKLRTDFANNIAARNAGLQQQSFENAANRNLQGAGIQTGREQFFGQQPFQNAQLQQGAANAFAQNALGLGGQSLQAQLANQQAGLNAQQFNVGNQMQTGQFNIANALQAALANQQSMNQAGQFNAGQMQNQQQFNLAQMLQGLGMAGQMQQGQNAQNAGLLGILAGQGVPQQQPSQMPGAIGDFGSTLAMLPMLQQMFRTGSQPAPTRAPAAPPQFPTGQSFYF